MTVFVVILLAAPFLMIVTLVFLALLVKGVRRADLRKPSTNRLDSITRRVVGGPCATTRKDREEVTRHG